ncbi:3-hydroxybutyryl-CoA dehydrogenase-like protein [Ilyonectria robusta]
MARHWTSTRGLAASPAHAEVTRAPCERMGNLQARHNLPTSTSTPSPSSKMASSILRMRSLGAARQVRCFSSSPRQHAAAEVKRLGVIGAGQMVGSHETHMSTGSISSTNSHAGTGNRPRCGAEGPGTNHPD